MQSSKKEEEINMFLKIGFDGGYGNTKVVTSKGQKVEVPSVVGGGFKRKYTDIFGGGKGLSQNNLHINLDGRDYFVGSLALKESRTPSSAFESNKINHPSNKVIIAATTALLMEQEREDMIIVASLPLAEFSRQKKEFKEYLADFNADVILYDNSKELRRNVGFKHVAVFPQGAAAAHYILSHYHSRIMNNTTFAVIDIGMKTLDVVVIEIGDGLEIIESMTFGFDIGVSLIHEGLYRVVQEETGVSLGVPELDMILRNNGRWNEYDFTEAIRNGKQELLRMVNDGISERWGASQRKRLNRVFIVGGGGQLLFDEFKGSKELSFIQNNIELPMNPRFANAYGCLQVAQEIERMVLQRR